MKTCSISVCGEYGGLANFTRFSNSALVAYLGLRSGKFGLLPLPKLKDSVPLCIDLKANYGELICEGLLKMLAIPGLNVENAFLIRRRVPPLSYLVRY
jgi:hypothetical protein